MSTSENVRPCTEFAFLFARKGDTIRRIYDKSYDNWDKAGCEDLIRSLGKRRQRGANSC